MGCADVQISGHIARKGVQHIWEGVGVTGTLGIALVSILKIIFHNSTYTRSESNSIDNRSCRFDRNPYLQHLCHFPKHQKVLCAWQELFNREKLVHISVLRVRFSIIPMLMNPS